MYMKRFLLVLICGLMSIHWLQATHIVGAELYYECIDSTRYRYLITLKLYRDCDRGQAPFDNPIEFFVFGAADSSLVGIYNIAKPPLTPRIVPRGWEACLGSIDSLCVEEGIYRMILPLPPRKGGYHLAWARCCRNSAITNLQVPLSQGVTFLAHLPDTSLARCNSMPTFNQVPPIFLCAGLPFRFDHSATDMDGDSLVYRLVNPYLGLDLMRRGAGNSTLRPGDPGHWWASIIAWGRLRINM